MGYTLIILGLSLILLLLVTKYLYSNRKKGILFKELLISFTLLQIHVVGLLLQILCTYTDISPIYFDYITYIGIVFHPVFLFYLSISYYNSNINIKKMLWVMIIPIVSLVLLWTNDYHHLFYIKYSININESVYGTWFYVHTIYSYAIILLSFIILIYSSIRDSGFFSKQTALIVTGGSVPLVVNILGTLKIVPMTIYITPILFIVTASCCAVAIIKYKALNIIPIALRTIINTMSDGFVVISKDGTIANKNKTFDDIFQNIFSRNSTQNNEDNLYSLIKKNKIESLHKLKEDIREVEKTKSMSIKEYCIITDELNKYFEVDIQPILSSRKKEYIGTLLLFKDITQHKEDIGTIEQKQDIIVKQAQLASIGELAGGVAHDINTPISAIKSGILMFREMLGERSKEEIELLQNMDNCADKIISIVNSMRNQIRNLGGSTNIEFKISDVIDDIRTLTYNEVAKNKCELIIKIEEDLKIKGDPTKLGQVLTNLIINAVQAYDKKSGKIILVLSNAPDNMALIKIIDNAGGMDDNIEPYIFKNILTTKGTIGTGLGLYLAYSVIRGEFGGDITFESQKGLGTTFYITIPKA